MDGTDSIVESENRISRWKLQEIFEDHVYENKIHGGGKDSNRFLLHY